MVIHNAKIKDLFNYVNGKSLENYFNYNSGYKVVSIGNFSEDSRYINTNTFVDYAYTNSFKNLIANKNDLVMILNDKTSIGTILGRVLLIDSDNAYIINQRSIILRLKYDKYIAEYFYYLINSSSVRKTIMKKSKPGTQIYLNLPDVLDLDVGFIPNKDEQKNIVNTLSDVDGMISSLEKLIEKKKAIKQGAMQELLTGKKRLPGFTGEWEEKTISQYGVFVSGNGFPLKHQGSPSGMYPFYKVSDFSNAGNGRIMVRANNYINETIADILSCSIIPKDSIVFAKIGAAIFLERKRVTGYDCCIDNNMMAFQPYIKEIASYMCYLFQTIKFGDLVEATALPSLSGKVIGEIKKWFPPTVEEQQAIATILSDMDNEIEALEQKLAKTRQLKQGMMQQLLTGKIRLV